ncbi:MAG: glycosyltransferase, partial [Bacteroidaceae bacterium]|nr:glycosyltransferase [Bacteroidaceae bacterium]
MTTDEGAGSQPPLKITIATVTYNAGPLIARTIKSVEEQTYPHVEHLVIDGNSQDDTLTQI